MSLQKFKPTEAQRKFVEREVSKWKKKLLLDVWSIEVVLKQGVSQVNENFCAEVNVDSVYKNAHMRVFPAFFAKTKAKQKEDILHEMVHIVLDEMGTQIWDLQQGKLITFDQRRDAIERTTQHLTRAIHE